MPEDIVEREGAIEGEDSEKEVPAEAVASAAQDESEPAEAVAEAGEAEPQAGQAGSEEPEKPKGESKVDWEDVAKRERYKRKREREAKEALEAQLAELTARSEQAKPAEAPAAAPSGSAPRMPSMSDPEIDYDEGKFQRAMLEYNDSILDRKLEEREREREARRRQDEARTKAEAYTDKLSAYAARNPEFPEAYANAGKPSFGRDKDSLLMESDRGPEVEHYLYSDLGRLDDFLEADQFKAMRIIVEAEKAIEDRERRKGVETRRKASGAPAPIEPTRGSAVAEDDFMAKYPKARILTSNT